jgi:NAD dependent epimerase/dehydratase family enzyme
MGRQADLLLHGQRAVSTKLDGFEFRYRTLRAALEDALAPAHIRDGDSHRHKSAAEV